MESVVNMEENVIHAFIVLIVKSYIQVNRPVIGQIDVFCVVNVSMKLPHNHPVANAMDVGNLIFFYEI
jgi:hypothetical protein